MRTKLNTLITFGMMTSILISCSDLTPHQKEMSRLEKKTARAEKQLEKQLKHLQRKYPDAIKPDGFYEKQGIEDALKRVDLRDAKKRYLQMLDKDIEVGIFPGYLETRLLEIVTPLPGSDFAHNHAGYDFLALLYPENKAYASKRDSYYQKLSRRQNTLISKLKTKVNKLDGITWYKHPNQPAYTNSRSTAYLYIGREETGKPWLRMQVQYTARKWLFVEYVSAWFDGEEKILIAGPFERDNNSDIWEWQDINPTQHQLDVMRSMGHAKEAVLRFQGNQYKKNVTLSSRDKKAILEMLAAYDAMTDQVILAETATVP